MHRATYRPSGGRLGTRFAGWQVLLLTTRGRRSGRPRSVTLNYLEDGAGVVVVATNARADRHPEWWLNLAASSEAEVHLGPASRRLRARRATGAERARLWASVVALDPSYDAYRSRTAREIPVVVLEPA